LRANIASISGSLIYELPMSELLIKNLSKYVTLTEEEKSVVLSLYSHKKYRKHQFILQEGDIARYESFIISGLTRTYEIDERGQEHIVQFGIEDWWVGDLYSYLTETPTIYNIDCLEDTEVLHITRADHELLYEKVPKLERHFRLLIQNAFITTVRRLSSTLTKTAAERYSEFLERYPHISQRVPNHQIAAYLGITPQSLSRIRAGK
jgi:CRP-like cAMP-binding protein